MCKTYIKAVDKLSKSCYSNRVKLWVGKRRFFNVVKKHDIFTFLPTKFYMVFSTHQPLLKTLFSPLYTPFITTIIIKPQKTKG
jgi:hypothetical protein